MKKMFLSLFIFLTAATVAFAENIPPYNDEEEVTITAPADSEEEAVTEEALPESVNEPPQITDSLADKVAQINSLQADEEKVKAWAKYTSEENYVIINKADCSATVYDTDGNEIKTFEVGIGMEKGDDFNDTKGLLGKAKNTTPAGEYTLIPNIANKAEYGDLTLSLGSKANKQSKDSKKVVALHKVPKFRQEARLKKFYDGNLANNRMSHGCINFIEEDFKELRKYIHGGLKTYVLPEEKDNQLKLTKNDKDEFELTQTKY